MKEAAALLPIGRTDRQAKPQLLFSGSGRYPPDRRGSLGMSAIVVALARFGRPLQAFLHGGLTESFIVLQINDGLVPNKGEIAVVTGERLDAGLAGKNSAPYREVDVFHAMRELCASLQILLLDPGREALPGSIGLLSGCERHDSRQRGGDSHNADYSHRSPSD